MTMISHSRLANGKEEEPTTALRRDALFKLACDPFDFSSLLAPSGRTAEIAGERATVDVGKWGCSESEFPGVELSKPDSEQLRWPGRTFVALAILNSSSFVEW